MQLMNSRFVSSDIAAIGATFVSDYSVLVGPQLALRTIEVIDSLVECAAGRLSHVLGKETPAVQTIMGSPQAWHASGLGSGTLSALSSGLGSVRGGKLASKNTDAQQFKQLQAVLR